jgi:hypothetical protein
MNPKDTQIVEIEGVNWLIVELMKVGIEVARPVRDRGVDLVVYNERKGNELVAKVIQVKASSAEAFSIDDKYEKIKGLLIVYIWNLESKPIAYALSYQEVLSIARKMEWLETESWKNGRYSTSKPNEKLKELLDEHKMDDKEKWFSKLFEDEKRSIS